MAGWLIDLYQQLGVELSAVRRQAVQEMVARGDTYAAIAQQLGLTKGRIGQIMKQATKP
jgi:DNA-binding NarL/FixJ family response regulator